MSRLLRQLARFAAVGLVGLLVDVAVLYAAAPWLGWYAARALSFLAAATVTWGLNRRFTFATRRPATSLPREYLHWLASMLGGAALNYATYAAALHLLPPHPGTPALAVALGSLTGLTLNFLAARHLVFQ